MIKNILLNWKYKIMLIKNRIKILIIYFLGTVWIILWKIIKLLRWNKKYNNENFNKIIINRSDRLGDAIISKPFIKLLINFLEKERIWNNFEILASSYNSFILEDLGKGNVNILRIEKKIDYEMNILKQVLKSLKLFFKEIFNWKNDKTDKNNLFIDLVGDPYLLKEYRKNSINIWPNLFLNSIFLDYQLPVSYVYHRNNKNLIEQYIDLIEWYFNFNWKFRNYIYDNINEFIPETNLDKKENILIFVWTKKYRNMSIDKWKEIINDFSKRYPKKKIIVIDDNQNLLYGSLKKEKFNNNVEIKENRFNLTEFIEFAKWFELIIWIDGWWMNMIRNLTNSITIYTLWNEKVWRQFSGRNKYKTMKLNNNWFIDYVEVNWKKIQNYYKKWFFLPTYDVEIEKKYFDDLLIIF